MFKKTIFAKILLLFVLAAGLAGCGGSDFVNVRTDTQGNVREVTSENYTLMDNVRMLQPDSGVEVAEINGDSLVLTGPVPPLAVGDVVVRGEGPSQFTRRVAGVEQQGERTVLTTERIGLNDIFQEADIQETIYLGAEFLNALEPSIPGVEIGEVVMVRAQGTEALIPAVRLSFSEAVVADDGRGSVKIDGSIWLTVGVRTDLQVGLRNFIIPTVNRFELVPLAVLGGPSVGQAGDVGGNLTVTGTGSGNFRKEIPITNPLSYPIVGFAGIGLNMQGTLNVVVDGSVQADGNFAITNAKVRLEAGVKYENGSWSGVQVVDSGFNINPPQLQAEANLSVSVAQPKLSLNLCDMGEVFLNAQALKFDAEARLVTNPSPGYQVTVYRTSGLELGARLAIGVAPISVSYTDTFPFFQGDRVQVAQIGVALPAPSSSDLFTLVIPSAETPEMKVGEERLFISLTAVRLGIAFVPLPLPVNWSSSDPSTVRLTNVGMFAIGRALKSGSSKISAVRASGVTGEWPQSVSTTGLTGIEILPGLRVGATSAKEVAGQQVLSQALPGDDQVPEFGSRDMRAIGTYANGQKVDLTYAVNWSASGRNAQAFRNGQVNGNLQGESELRVTDPTTGRTAQTTVEIVRVPIETLLIFPLSPTRLELTGGQTTQLRASARFSDGSIREVTRFVRWVSSDPFIAKVNEQGLVRAETPGEVTIRAIDQDGYAVASKTVVINRAALASLRLRPTNVGPFRPGQTQQFRATAVFADGTESSATNDVKWSTSSTSIARISQGGLVTVLAPGSFKVKALIGRVTATTPVFEVDGPAGFVYTAQPADVETGTPFSITVETRDVNNEIWTEPVQVTLELESGPGNAELGGALTRTTGTNGRVTFTDLTINQVGPGYKLRAVSPGLSVAVSEEFEGLTPGGGTGPVGRVFFNETQAADGVGALNVLAISADGTFVEESGSPYNTSGVARSLTKVGNFLVVAIGGSGTTKSSLQSFEYDSVTGSLTARAQTAQDSLGPSFPGLFKLDSGGGNIVVSLSTFDNLLKAWRVGNDGSLTLLDTENLVGTDIGFVEYYDAPGATDFVYLSCVSPRTIIGFALDTTTGTFSAVPGSPYTVPFNDPGALESYPGNLFVALPTYDTAPDADDFIRRYVVNDTTGALTADAISYGVGDGPSAMHASAGYLYVANRFSADIATYIIGQDGLFSHDGGNFTPAGEVNPHSFAEVTLSSPQRALYVATSTKVAALLINAGNGLLQAISGSPFGSYDSPGDIRN